ncbi:SpaA isopeptide-forming pilin-related protein [Enterococcus casseliflavus]|uniref:SpaA isopeptide-forming pilin-related protein n=1 Tax=Enterococcus casseliflavus TaxID=37734 RepID=UPI0009C04DB3|nr:hypothetical protein BH739_16920 [Enterococcus casseliflavus]
MYMKKIRKTMFCFMSLLILIQYLMPVVVFALDYQEEFKLNSLIVTKEENSTIEAKLDISINSQEGDTQVVTFNENAIVKNVTAESKTESNQIDYVVNKNKIEMKIAPGLTVSVSLTVELDSSNLEEDTLIATSGSQVVQSTLTKTNSIKESTIISSKNESSNETSEQLEKETTTTESTTHNSSVESSESLENSKQVKKDEKEVSKDPQDVRSLLVSLGMPSTIIESANILYTDKDGTPYPDQTSVPVDANVEVKYEWRIPEELFGTIKDGDYFDFQLPDGVQVFPGTGSLAGALGQYGSYEITADGKVHIVFNKNVETDHDVSGDFNYSTKFDKTVEPGDVVIKTPTEENFPSSEIHIRPKYDQAIDKSGYFDRTPNPSKVVWEVNINRPLNKMINGTLKDPMPKGTTLIGVEVYPETVDVNGNVTNIDLDNPLVEGTDYTLEENDTITFIGDYAETNKAFHVVYESKIEEDQKPEKGGNVSFKNEATLDDGKSTTSAEASVIAQYKGPISKSGPSPTGKDQVYKWSVQYNYNEKKHAVGASITDTMSENLSLVDGTVKLHKITFDKDGKEVTGTVLEEGTTYKLVKDSSNPNVFTIEFLEEVDYAVKIDYQTKVNEIVDENTEISNFVKTDNNDESGSEGNATQQGIVKRIDGEIDYSAREIPWEIQINNAGYWMTNWTLEDVFSAGLILVDESFEIVDTSDGNKVLEENQYTLTKKDSGFNVSFNGDLKEGTDHKFTIRYKTKFDTSVIDEGTGNEDSIKFTNDASMKWKDTFGDEHSNKESIPFDPVPAFKFNGQKSGNYNAKTKKITWTVAVNFNQQKLTNATIIDPIIEPQDYVETSAKLYEATINKNGTYTLNNEVTGVITEPTTENSSVKVNLPEGSTQAYVLVFETSLDGEIINEKTYNNKATFENNGISHDLDASISPAHSGELVTKSGQQDSDDSGYVKWDLTVNGSQSTLHDVKIVDTPSANQFVTNNDILIFGTIVDHSGNIIKDKNIVLKEGEDYTITIDTNNETGAQVITIELLNKITTSYIVEYRALITSEKTTDTVTNGATISAVNEKVVTQDIEKAVVVSNSSGSATGSKGSVTLVKEGKDGTKLANAHLQLWTINENGEKDKLVREGDTDTDGELRIGNLRVQDYLVIETKAPIGYTISNELLHGKRISVTKDEENSTFKIEKILNELTKVSFNKVGQSTVSGETTSPLKGAEFEILDNEGKLIKGYEKVVSDEKGIVTVEGLVPGEYQIVETKAPEGYILDNKPLIFTLVENENGVIPFLNLGSWINYQGSAQLVKSDSKGNLLAGAEFKIIDKDGRIIHENLVSDKKGTVSITELAPGDYQFIETKAPEGYVLNTTPVAFTIEDSAKGQPKVVVASEGFVNYKGSAQLVKTDSEGNPLSGAEFKVVDKEGKAIQEGLVSDKKGTVSITELAPGDYQFIETKAPEGYVLNTTPVVFTIEDSAKGQPKVVVASEGFVNYKGSAQLVKTDSEGNPLSGAEFKVVDNKGKNIQEGLVSDEKGIVSIIELAPGDYQFIETKAPEGYVLNTTPIVFTIETSTASKPAVVAVSEDYINYKGSAQLLKTNNEDNPLSGAEFKVIDKEGKTIQEGLVSDEKGIVSVIELAPGDYQFIETKAPEGYVLNTTPVAFTIEYSAKGQPKVVVASEGFVNYKGSAQLVKTDSEGNPLSGAEFKVVDNKGKAIQEGLVSDEKGIVSITELAPGDYQFIETKAPEGYILNTTPVVFTIEYSAKGQPKVVVASEGFVNYKGSAQLVKTDSEGNPLSGAEFKVVDNKGKAIQEGLVSDEKGIVSITELAPGDYQFIETKAPEGYILNTTPVVFTIEYSAKGQPKVVVASEGFVNYKGSAQLVKTDSEGNPLSGAEFKVVDKEGKAIQEGLVSDEKGIVSITELAPGDYQFIETKAPEGYIINPTATDFSIKYSIEGQPEVVIASEGFVNYQGSAQLLKTNSEGNPLSGAEFKVVDTKGEVIKEGIISNADGIVSVTGLASGDYQFIETKAPEGFILNSTVVNFTIKAEAADEPEVVVASESFVNYQGSAQLLKTDSKENPLPGAKFKIIDKEGKTVIQYIVSDDKGVVLVKNLAPGDYQFIETKAPRGYVLDETPFEFTIVSEALGEPSLVDVGEFENKAISTIENSEKGSSHDKKLPKTNDQDLVWMEILGVIILIFIGIIVYFRQKIKLTL